MIFFVKSVRALSLRYHHVITEFQLFLSEDFIRKSTKTTLLTKYIHIQCMYIPPPAAYTNIIIFLVVALESEGHVVEVEKVEKRFVCYILREGETDPIWVRDVRKMPRSKSLDYKK